MLLMLLAYQQVTNTAFCWDVHISSKYYFIFLGNTVTMYLPRRLAEDSQRGVFLVVVYTGCMRKPVPTYFVHCSGGGMLSLYHDWSGMRSSLENSKVAAWDTHHLSSSWVRIIPYSFLILAHLRLKDSCYSLLCLHWTLYRRNSLNPLKVLRLTLVNTSARL